MTITLMHLYLIALGSNQRHPLIGAPRKIVEQALIALETQEIDVFQRSSVFISAPLGPSQRRYANAAAIITTRLNPPELLERLHAIEAHFGRTRRGQRWSARILDLDIILWSEGIWADTDPHLAIPHAAMRERAFVLTPAAMIAPHWRDPVTGRTLRQLQSRLSRPKRVDHAPQRH